MTRTTTIVTLAILSSILTPVVVSATGTTQKAATPEPQARIETAAATTPAPAAETPACTRRVKVVYAGYGEAHAAACAATADTRR
jgi:hypothetical protein